jgi:hypothetical protein
LPLNFDVCFSNWPVGVKRFQTTHRNADEVFGTHRGLARLTKCSLVPHTMEFVLTSDLDWASESCVETFLRITDRYSVKPTLFLTHESVPARRAFEEGRAELGIHPNFLANSDHGGSVDAVIEYNLRLVPQPVAVRNHRFIDTPEIQAALVEHGLKFDSNACRHLERELRLCMLPSGLRRYPVFFEDDVHWSRGLDWNFGAYAHDFFSSGLKILNFHPFFVALNIPNAEFYKRHQPHIRTLTQAQAMNLRHPGPGAQTFLIEALDMILLTGHCFIPFSEMTSQSLVESDIGG